jgi:hypothetical protein
LRRRQDGACHHIGDIKVVRALAPSSASAVGGGQVRMGNARPNRDRSYATSIQE